MMEGTQVGTYRVLSRIGEGGMGSVWLAEHIALGRRAALKVLHPEFSSRPDIVQRFFNEARAATSIGDPGIVQIFDFGHHIDGGAYIVMELLDGEALDRRLKRHGSLAIPDALRIMRQVASTLGAAHARGIVHRDLKPENIFMVRDPEVIGGERAKILDFGIAKLMGDPAGSKTQTSTVMGTPTFMSPEQCRGAGHVDQRSDVYALGCVLFTLIIGRPPFDAEGVGDIIAMHLRETPPVPSQLRRDVPREVDQLILHCLAKDPAHRFGSAGDLAVALGALLGTGPNIGAVHGVGTNAPPYSSSKPTTLSSATGASSGVQHSGSRATLAIGLAGLAAVGGVVAILAMRGSKKRETESANTAGLVVAADTSDAASAPEPAPTTKEVPPSPPADDPARVVSDRIVEVLSRFAMWSPDHAGATCPDQATLGTAVNDPWGHPLSITCTDQPADHVIGVVSVGPDGTAQTADDIASWQLAAGATAVVRGPRWQTKTKPAPTPTAAVVKPSPAGSSPQPRPITTKPADAKNTSKKRPKAVELDEFGLPVAR